MKIKRENKRKLKNELTKSKHDTTNRCAGFFWTSAPNNFYSAPVYVV